MAMGDDDFRVRPGRPRADRSGRSARKVLSFERQVMVAVAKAGGNPKHIGKALRGGGKAARNGRYNAHGRGAKVMRSLPRDPGSTSTAARASGCACVGSSSRPAT